MLPEKIIFIGVGINLLCSLWYIRSIFKERTKPNLISWFIWMLAPMIGTFLALKAGAGLVAFGIFMAGFGPLLVIIFSIFKKNSFWKIKIFDIICGIFSILALLLYFKTKNISLAILSVIIADLLAYLPTYLKTWQKPESENASAYLGGIINNILALLIITEWSFSIYGFSIYLISANLLQIIFINRKKLHFKKLKV